MKLVTNSCTATPALLCVLCASVVQICSDDDEARALLLSIDPLASLAHTQQQLQDRLLEITPVSDADLRAAWEAAANPELARLLTEPPRPGIRSNGWSW